MKQAWARRLRFLVRLSLELIRRHRRLIYVGALVGSFAFLLLPRLSGAFFDLIREEKIGLIGRYTLAELPLEVQEKVSFGLTKISPSGEATPAASIRWQSRRLGQEYVFELNDELTWHDGQKLEAEDISYNFRDITTEVISPSVIKYVLKEPFSPFPTVVSQPLFKKGFVGLGDYRITRIKRSGQVVEAVHLSPLDNQSPKIVYKFYPTEADAITGFKLGEIDRLVGVSSTESFTSWPELKIDEQVSRNRYLAVFFNTSHPAFSSKNVRQALAYLIEKDPNRVRAYGPISSKSWAYNENLKPYDFDPQRADELLEDEEKEILNGLEIKITTSATHLDLAEQVAKDWGRLGISATTQISATIPGDFDVLVLAQEIPADPDQYALWHSTQAGNISGYQSPQLDKLLEDGRKTINQEERKTIYRDFQRFLIEDTLVIFLYHPTVYTIERR